MLFEEIRLKNDRTDDDYEHLVSSDIKAIRTKFCLEDDQLSYRIIKKDIYRQCHWRLIFCIRCAIHIDAGLRFSSRGLKNTASWVGGNDLVPHIEMFEPYFSKN